MCTINVREAVAVGTIVATQRRVDDCYPSCNLV